MSQPDKPTRKRKNSVDRDQELINKIKHSSVWTVLEKENFLVGLKKYGFSNLRGIAKVVGTKTADEVRHFCLVRKQKLSSALKDKPHSETKLEAWIKKIHLCKDPRIHTHFPYNQSALKEAMVSAEIECKKTTTKQPPRFLKLENSDDSNSSIVQLPDYPNLASIYKYLTSLMANEVPTYLGPSESLIALNLLSDLLGVLKMYPFEKEKQFLNSLPERETAPFTKNVKKEIQDDGAKGEGSSNFNISKYPKLDIMDHPFKFALSEMNELQIPKEFLKEEYQLIDNLLKEREKLLK